MTNWARISRLLILLLVTVLLLSTIGGAEARRRRRRNRGRRNRGRRNRGRRHQHWHNQAGQEKWWELGHLSGAAHEHSHTHDERPPEQAHSMLVLQWPESLCAAQKRGCKGTIHGYFTLHGVWPIARSHVNCRADFDPLKLHELEANLTQVWPSYFHRSSMQFWKHEYDKHGSCLAPTIEEYFRHSLALHAAYPLLDILTPSADVAPLDYFLTAMKTRLGVEPMVMCSQSWLDRLPDPNNPAAGRKLRPDVPEPGADESGYEGGDEQASDDEEDEDESPNQRRGRHHRKKKRKQREQLLVEVGVCFDIKGTPVDCPVKGRIRRCRRNQDVALPLLGSFTGTKPALPAVDPPPVVLVVPTVPT